MKYLVLYLKRGFCLHFDDSILSGGGLPTLFQRGGRQLTCCRGFQSLRTTAAAKTGAQHRLNEQLLPNGAEIQEIAPPGDHLYSITPNNWYTCFKEKGFVKRSEMN